MLQEILFIMVIDYYYYYYYYLYLHLGNLSYFKICISLSLPALTFGLHKFVNVTIKLTITSDTLYPTSTILRK